MINVVIYAPETGEIRRTMTLVDEEEADLNCGPGEAWVEGSALISRQRVINGEVVDKDAAVLEERDVLVAWAMLRAERDRKLAACDWTQVPDAPVNKVVWADYRQALRDLPGLTTDPRNPVWPEPPSS